MCGIAGMFNLGGEAVRAPEVQRMIDVMAYRGPDGHGVYVDKNVGLGHRRLAIIDLSPAGHQPSESLRDAPTAWSSNAAPCPFARECY